MTTQAEAKAFMLRCQREPVWFAREVLGDDPWQRQAEILESVRDNKRTVVRSCHGIGKSRLAGGMLLPWWLYCHPNSRVVTTAPTARQVEKIIWKEVGAAHARAERRGISLGGRVLQTEINIAPGWDAIGFTSDDPNAVQGWHSEHLLLIVDEASGIDPELDEAFEGVLTSEHCRVIKIGNPTDPTGPLAKEFKSAGAAKFAISAFDSPNFTEFGITRTDIIDGKWEAKMGGARTPRPYLITPEWVADKVRRWGVNSPAFKSRVDGAFPELGDDTLIPLGWIEAAQAREYVAKDADTKTLAVDVARFGGDETVFGLRQGWRYRTHKAYRGQDTMATAGHVVRALSETGAKHAAIDSNGVGGGVYDRLKEMGKKVVSMGAGEGANDKERFLNARAEWFWSLREAFEEGLVDIDPLDDDLLGQLSNLKYRVDSKGRIQIESKDDMKKRGLPSPDRADTMAMAFAAVGSKAIQRRSARAYKRFVSAN